MDSPRGAGSQAGISRTTRSVNERSRCSNPKKLQFDRSRPHLTKDLFIHPPARTTSPAPPKLMLVQPRVKGGGNPAHYFFAWAVLDFVCSQRKGGQTGQKRNWIESSSHMHHTSLGGLPFLIYRNTTASPCNLSAGVKTPGTFAWDNLEEKQQGDLLTDDRFARGAGPTAPKRFLSLFLSMFLLNLCFYLDHLA